MTTQTYLYARDIATMYRVQVGTVHSWAARYGWTRRRMGGNRTQYLADDVQATYDALQAAKEQTAS